MVSQKKDIQPVSKSSRRGVLLGLSGGLLGLGAGWWLSTGQDDQEEDKLSVRYPEKEAEQARLGNERVLEKTLGYEMVKIPAPPNGKAFLMMRTEVTQALYEKIIGKNPSVNIGSEHPVEMVSWVDGVNFCNELSKRVGLQMAYRGTGNDCSLIKGSTGFRFPFEDEWEWAAEGGEAFEFAGSDLLDEVAWYRGNAGNQTHPVAQKKANGYGLYDMIGNVGEWCADDDLHPGEHFAGAQFRVVRGAGCQFKKKYCATSTRSRLTPLSSSGSIGLRLCRSI